MSRFQENFSDAEYWLERAEEAYAQALQAAACGQLMFAKTLETHAKDYEELSKVALMIHQSRRRLSKVSPEYREKMGVAKNWSVVNKD